MLKVNDVVVGNAMASQYGITCPGWVGVVTSIDEEDSNLIWVRPFNGPDDDRYHVSMECFDLYKTYQQGSTKSTKQEILDRLGMQKDCYFSLAQVVEMINKIEDPKPVLSSKVQVTADGYDSFLDAVRERFEANFAGRRGTSRFIDLGTAEFSLNGNEIELDSVELDSDEVVDTAVECLENVLIQYVEVLEKSELLEA